MASYELLSEHGFRSDGRKAHEIRKINCSLGIFEQADGSAYFEMGNTRVLAAVYGPHEIRGGRSSKAVHDKAFINCQYSMATFSTFERKRRPRGDFRSLEITSNLKDVFETAILRELYPHSQIDIFLQILQSDGSNYSACVNAATLAIIHAGIPIKDIVSSCSSGYVNNQPITDVNQLEEQLSSGPTLTVALVPKSNQILSMESSGRIHLDAVDKVMDSAMQGALDVYQIMKSTVNSYVSQIKE